MPNEFPAENACRIPQGQANYEQARCYFERRLDFLTETGDISGQLRMLRYMGVMFQNQGELEQARILCDHSQRLFRQLNDS